MNIKTLLANPAWQGISGVFGLLSFLITIFGALSFANNVDKEITITSNSKFIPGIPKDSIGRLSFLVDGKVFNNIIWEIFTISNSGRSPIKPEDFIEPISLRLNDDSLSLLLVYHTDVLTTDVITPEEILRVRKGMRPWKRNDMQFTMEPLLLNPGDELSAITLSGNNSMTPDAFFEKYALKSGEQKLFLINARIAGLKKIKFLNPEKDFGYQRSKIIIGYKYLITDLQGSYVYLFLILSIILSFLSQLLVMFTHPFSRHTWINATISIFGVLLSIFTSEILVSANAHGVSSQAIPGICIVSVFSFYVFSIIRYRSRNNRDSFKRA